MSVRSQTSIADRPHPRVRRQVPTLPRSDYPLYLERKPRPPPGGGVTFSSRKTEVETNAPSSFFESDESLVGHSSATPAPGTTGWRSLFRKGSRVKNRVEPYPGHVVQKAPHSAPLEEPTRPRLRRMRSNPDLRWDRETNRLLDFHGTDYGPLILASRAVTVSRRKRQDATERRGKLAAAAEGTRNPVYFMMEPDPEWRASRGRPTFVFA